MRTKKFGRTDSISLILTKFRSSKTNVVTSISNSIWPIIKSIQQVQFINHGQSEVIFQFPMMPAKQNRSLHILGSCEFSN